ncbi:MAG: hypothetical protein KA371_00540 [Acidobacteria bacterium]|nr:hypothetical protein [Acidobacteriota bacterium]
MRTAILAFALVAGGSLAVEGQAPTARPVALPPPAEPTPGQMCEAPDPGGRLRKAAVGAGGALSYRQDPPWLLARDDHGMRLRRFVVAGDVERVRFDRWDTATNGYIEETWTRERSETVAGHVVSVFEPSWPADVIQQRLATARVGLDNASLWLGYFRGPAEAPSVYHSVYLRVGSSAIGPTDVVRIDDTVQYASHVVNLVVPDFGDRRLVDDFDLRAVARRFYAHFDDTYDVLAVVPQDGQVDGIDGYHLRVRNDVEGVGLTTFNRAAEFGSAGRLLGVEVFHQTGFVQNDISNHELAHTWGHAFDWTRIAGIARAGHAPAAHGPLMTGGESLVGAVLGPSRRPALHADGTAVIERTPAPARHHPLDLYAMGLLDAPALPEFVVFEDQGQFSTESSSTPDPGTSIGGGRRTVSINDVMAAHGARRGPVVSELKRATIVVSRDGLLPADELALWNFFAARHEDAAGTGVVDYEGQGSFDASTGRRIDLSASIKPQNADPLPRTQDPEPARLGARDCRGFEFATPPPTRVRAGERFTIAGRVTARDRTDFSRVMFRFWPSDDVSERAERAYADASRSGEFRVDVEIRPGREGQYSVEGFLFWPDASPQYSRCRLSVVTVTP